MRPLMNIPTSPAGENPFRAHLLSCKVPPELVREILDYHTNLSYAPGAMIFHQDAPADIILWVVKGLVKESCPGRSGNKIVVRLATAGGGVRDDYAATCPGAADQARFRVAAGSFRADERGVVGMGSLLRVVDGNVVPRTVGTDSGRAGTKTRRARRRRHRADVRAGARRSGRDDRQLAPDGKPTHGRPDCAGRNRAARTSLHFIEGRYDPLDREPQCPCRHAAADRSSRTGTLRLGPTSPRRVTFSRTRFSLPSPQIPKSIR